MHTNHGPIELELFEADAPKTVENFVKLSRDGYYDGLIFHRVIPDFMVQGGCPRAPGPADQATSSRTSSTTTRSCAARSRWRTAGPDTNGSQFFIVTTEAAPWLDGKHTVFGQVASGMEAVDAIEGLETGPGDRPVEDAKIERMEVHAVELLWWDGCPSHPEALDELRGMLLEEGWTRRSSAIEIETTSRPRRESFPGSPTIRVDGRDIVPPARASRPR